MVESFQTFVSITGNAFDGFVDTFLGCQSRFGKEFIGKTDNLLFETERNHLSVRYRQLHRFYLC